MGAESLADLSRFEQLLARRNVFKLVSHAIFIFTHMGKCLHILDPGSPGVN